MGLSHHTKTAIAHALCDPAASDELIRVVEALSDFASKFPIPEGNPIDPSPRLVAPSAGAPPPAEPAPAPDTGLSVGVTAEATVVSSVEVTGEPDPTALTASRSNGDPIPPVPPATQPAAG